MEMLSMYTKNLGANRGIANVHLTCLLAPKLGYKMEGILHQLCLYHPPKSLHMWGVFYIQHPSLTPSKCIAVPSLSIPFPQISDCPFPITPSLNLATYPFLVECVFLVSQECYLSSNSSRDV
jgi:hypothetical protein